MKPYALGIVGTGLIGGSMAIDLRRRGFAGSVLGVEADPVAAAAAEKLGCHEIISEDFNSGQMYHGMVAINPFEQRRKRC